MLIDAQTNEGRIFFCPVLNSITNRTLLHHHLPISVVLIELILHHHLHMQSLCRYRSRVVVSICGPRGRTTIFHHHILEHFFLVGTNVENSKKSRRHNHWSIVLY